MNHKTRASIVAAVLSAGLAGPAAAIVISVGTADSDYINLGNSAAYNSVGQIYGADSQGAFAASGVLIAQDWVLTAAHVTSGATALTFFMDSGGSWDSFATRSGISADRWYSHSKWTGNLGSGYDIGLFHLSASVGCGASFSSSGGCAAERYGGTGELNRISTEVGFGMTGTGATGATTFDGLKRAGQNMVDALYNTPGSDRILLADFDSGSIFDNNFGGAAPLSRESMIGSGDSGGGLFESISGHNYLVGITSFGWGRLDANPDSDYGDVGGWTRVSSFNSWINTVMSGGSSDSPGGGHGKGSTQGQSLQAFQVGHVPEPATFALLGLGLAGLGFSRRRQR